MNKLSIGATGAAVIALGAWAAPAQAAPLNFTLQSSSTNSKITSVTFKLDPSILAPTGTLKTGQYAGAVSNVTVQLQGGTSLALSGTPSVNVFCPIPIPYPHPKPGSTVPTPPVAPLCIVEFGSFQNLASNTSLPLSYEVSFEEKTTGLTLTSNASWNTNFVGWSADVNAYGHGTGGTPVQ